MNSLQLYDELVDKAFKKPHSERVIEFIKKSREEIESFTEEKDKAICVAALMLLIKQKAGEKNRKDINNG